MDSAKAGSHKQHHYVPEFYLRAWATPDGSQADRLTYFKWIPQRLHSDRISPKGAASQPFLYSLEHAAPEERQSLERDFFAARVDDPAAPIIAKMIRGGERLSEAEGSVFAKYVIAQRFRVPAYVEHVRREGSLAVEDMVADLEPQYQAVRRSDHPGRLSEFVRQTMPHLPDHLGIQSLPRLIDQPSLANSLMEMAWGWGRLDARGRNLLTCDRPAVFTHGLGDPKCIVALPLSATVAFFAMKGAESLQRLLDRPARDLVGRLNENILSQAREYVYARDELQRPFIEKHFRLPDAQPAETFRPLRPGA